VIRAENKAEQK